MNEQKTPKDIFLTKLYEAMMEFEAKTGTEIHNIKLHRTNNTQLGQMYQHTIIEEYEMEIK